MSKSLVEAGLQMASSRKSNSQKGTIRIDRTIYHTVKVTDSEGKVLFDVDGNPVVRNTAYVLAGSYLSPEVYDIALEKEKEFIKLNELFRKDMERRGITWRIPNHMQTTLSIQGVT